MRNNSFSEDEPWKELLNGSFFDMLRSVLPEMAQGTETSKPIRFLETELRQLAPFTRRFSSSQPFIDILAEAPLLTEENAGTLHHEDIGGGVPKRRLRRIIQAPACTLPTDRYRSICGAQGRPRLCRLLCGFFLLNRAYPAFHPFRLNQYRTVPEDTRPC